MKRILALHFATILLVGLSPLASAAPLPLKDEAEARKVYLTKCSKCHKLYDPSKYSDAKWEAWMGKMSKKAKLTPEQETLLSAYILQKFRSGAGRQESTGR